MPSPQVHAAAHHRAGARVNAYEENAYAMSQGKLLYENFNCVGCHFHGGGGIGPPLMDDKWIYGSEPDQIFATIIAGPAQRHAVVSREDPGLPGLADRRVRAQSERVGEQPGRAGRSDHMQMQPPENSMRQSPRRVDEPTTPSCPDGAR